MADWNIEEIEAIVHDYFKMLSLELMGQQYNKTEHRRKLMETVNRSHGSIEYKHQNISAILIEFGMPYISGYKPAYNYQKKILPEIVLSYLESNSYITKEISKDVIAEPVIPSVEDVLSTLVSPPKLIENDKLKVAEKMEGYEFKKIDYLAREAANQSLGKAGEEFVVNFEKARLIASGKESLADKVEHISVTEGDHVGYDILSFEKSGKERFIEAKTTKYGISTPFYISSNEVEFSNNYSDSYFLYRVFDFRKKPHLFMLQGAVKGRCSLSAINYRANCFCG